MEANSSISARPDADPEEALVYLAGLTDGGDGSSWWPELTFTKHPSYIPNPPSLCFHIYLQNILFELLCCFFSVK